MARTKFFWTHKHRRNESSDKQGLLIRLADQMRLKYLISEADDITTDLCISVPDEKLICFLEAMMLGEHGKHGVEYDPICENEVQQTIIQTVTSLRAVVDPTPLEEWETSRVQRMFEFGSVAERRLDMDGNPLGGDPVSVCIRADGNTPERGIARIQELLEEAVEGRSLRLESLDDGFVQVVVFENRETGEYINVYINVNNLDAERDDVPEAVEEV